MAEHYFELPKGNSPEALYGISLRIHGIAQPAYVQVAFPSSDVVFDSVLEEFMQDIAWLWIPFMLLMLATNLLVAHIALRPLSQTVEEAEAIQPGGVSVTLSEKGLPDDVLALVRAVNQALGRLRQGYRAQEEFVGDMAHEAHCGRNAHVLGKSGQTCTVVAVPGDDIHGVGVSL